MLICAQFIGKDLNLWFTLLPMGFEKLIFSDYWDPLKGSPFKSSGAFKKDPTFGFLTFEYALKNCALGRPFLKYCPVSIGQHLSFFFFILVFSLFGPKKHYFLLSYGFNGTSAAWFLIY